MEIYSARSLAFIRSMAWVSVYGWTISLLATHAWAQGIPASGQSSSGSTLQEDRDYRQPVDMVLSSDEQRVAVALQKTGEIWVWNIDQKSMQQKLSLQPGLVDFEPLSDGYFAAVNRDQNAIEILKWKVDGIERVTTHATSAGPVRCEWVPQTHVLRVACLWSKRIENFRFDKDTQTLSRVDHWDLNFSPRVMKTLPQKQLCVVADAFGVALAMVDSNSGKIVRQHSYLGHGIVDIESVSPDFITLAHATVNDFAETTENDIHWGVLLGNDLRSVLVDHLLHESREEVYRGGKIRPVGVPGNGAAELTAFRISREGYRVVAVGGTNQVAVGKEKSQNFRYVNVGTYPVSIVIRESTQQALVANKFEDCISLIDLHRAKLTDTLFMGPIRELTEEEKGEKLFHDGTLSHDRWMTCASCHVDGHTNGLLTDNLGDRTYGAAKRTISLLGNYNTAPYSWRGLDPSLHTQIVRSVDKTMQSYRHLDADEVEHIAAYCRTLASPPSVRASRGIEDSSLIEKGRLVFAKQSCVECHIPPTYTSPNSYDVGIRDEKGSHEFNPPSLRGLSQRGPHYFHDNRAEGLDQVLKSHPRQDGPKMTEEEKQALIAFLESL